MAEAKIHPPSPSRIAEARAAGLAPLPRLSGLALAILGLLLLRQLAPELWRSLGALLRDPLVLWAQGEPAQALVQARALLGQIGRLLALALGFVGAWIALGLALIQGPVFVWPRRARRPLHGPRPGWLSAALGSLGLLALLAFCLHDALWLTPETLAPLLSRWGLRLGGLALGLLLLDASLARERFFRALWLTRREQRDEWREAFGAPELRAARAERKREQHGAPT
jgi:flagellar biosynthesis protein FlhB